jgi:hypothetical protein
MTWSEMAHYGNMPHFFGGVDHTLGYITRNPFSRGLLQNVIDFVRQSERGAGGKVIDWMTIYTLDDYAKAVGLEGGVFPEPVYTDGVAEDDRKPPEWMRSLSALTSHKAQPEGGRGGHGHSHAGGG